MKRGRIAHDSSFERYYCALLASLVESLTSTRSMRSWSERCTSLSPICGQQSGAVGPRTNIRFRGSNPLGRATITYPVYSLTSSGTSPVGDRFRWCSCPWASAQPILGLRPRSVERD